MAMIHRLFRAGFGEAPDLVRRVDEGDRDHAAVVADHLALLSISLHTHHEGEDERLWSALEERAPSCTVHVERMKEQHAAMVPPLRDLDAAVPAWRVSASAADAGPVLAALDGVNAALAVHLPDEEANIVPVMETVITQKEVDWAGEHGRKATPKGQMWNTLGLMLSSQPDGGEHLLNHGFPAPVRLLWRYVGARKYATHRAALEGR
jgi:hemerythrin-like domain-containing protein